jgi:hypothetical protein
MPLRPYQFKVFFDIDIHPGTIARVAGIKTLSPCNHKADDIRYFDVIAAPSGKLFNCAKKTLREKKNASIQSIPTPKHFTNIPNAAVFE